MAENADENGMNGDSGVNTDAGEDETGSESEPAALSSGVEGREPEGMQTPRPGKVCVAEESEEMGHGLGSARGCG